MAAAMDAEPSTVIDIEARAPPLRLLDLLHLRLLLCRSARLLRLPARRRAPAACALTCARTALSPRARRRMRRCTRDARAARGCSSLQSVAAPAWSSRRCAWRRSTPSRATTRSSTRRRARRCAALHGRQPYLPRRRLQLTRARAAAQVMEKINGRLGAEHMLDKEWVEQTDKRAAQARVVPGAALSAPALSLRRRAHALARAPAEARAPGGGAERRQVKLSQGARLASGWCSCALDPDASSPLRPRRRRSAWATPSWASTWRRAATCRARSRRSCARATTAQRLRTSSPCASPWCALRRR